MSLLDAFLEEGLEESVVNATGPKEVWFAIRADGKRGRGTREDPYNGSEFFLAAENKLQFDTVVLESKTPLWTLSLGLFALRKAKPEQAVLDVDDLAARIKNFYRDPALLREYSEAGRCFAESLHWDQLLPQWLPVISAAAGVNLAR
jgi:hypothetical protein